MQISGSRTLPPRYRDHLLRLENGLRGETRPHENHCSPDRSTFSYLGRHLRFSCPLFFILNPHSISFYRIYPIFCMFVLSCSIINCRFHNTYLHELRSSGILLRGSEVCLSFTREPEGTCASSQRRTLPDHRDHGLEE